jgi:hypothetical protein
MLNRESTTGLSVLAMIGAFHFRPLYVFSCGCDNIAICSGCDLCHCLWYLCYVVFVSIVYSSASLVQMRRVKDRVMHSYPFVPTKILHQIERLLLIMM